MYVTIERPRLNAPMRVSIDEALERLQAGIELGAQNNGQLVEVVLKMPLDELRERMSLFREGGRIIAEMTSTAIH